MPKVFLPCCLKGKFDEPRVVQGVRVLLFLMMGIPEMWTEDSHLIYTLAAHPCMP